MTNLIAIKVKTVESTVFIDEILYIENGGISPHLAKILRDRGYIFAHQCDRLIIDNTHMTGEDGYLHVQITVDKSQLFYHLTPENRDKVSYTCTLTVANVFSADLTSIVSIKTKDSARLSDILRWVTLRDCAEIIIPQSPYIYGSEEYIRVALSGGNK